VRCKPSQVDALLSEDRIVEMSEEDADCLIRAGWTKLAESSADEAA